MILLCFVKLYLISSNKWLLVWTETHLEKFLISFCSEFCDTIACHYVKSFTTQCYLYRQVWTNCSNANNKLFSAPSSLWRMSFMKGNEAGCLLDWSSHPPRWLEEVINWGSSVSKRVPCFYACRPANNIIKDCQAHRMLCRKNVQWWLQCRETDKLQIYKFCVQDVGRSECVELGSSGRQLH